MTCPARLDYTFVVRDGEWACTGSESYSVTSEGYLYPWRLEPCFSAHLASWNSGTDFSSVDSAIHMLSHSSHSSAVVVQLCIRCCIIYRAKAAPLTGLPTKSGCLDQ